MGNCVILLSETPPRPPTAPSVCSSSCCQGQEAFQQRLHHVHSNITVSSSVTWHHETKQQHHYL